MPRARQCQVRCVNLWRTRLRRRRPLWCSARRSNALLWHRRSHRVRLWRPQCLRRMRQPQQWRQGPQRLS